MSEKQIYENLDSSIRLLNENVELKKIIEKAREYIEKYEAVIGYYDSNYDGEYDTYSHDLVKEELLEILEKENKYGKKRIRNI